MKCFFIINLSKRRFKICLKNNTISNRPACLLLAIIKVRKKGDQIRGSRQNPLAERSPGGGGGYQIC